MQLRQILTSGRVEKLRRIFFAERETHAEPSDVYTEIHKAKVRSAVTKLCGKKTSKEMLWI
jgi:hypothetical protein